jgi:hypothetical protein
MVMVCLVGFFAIADEKGEKAATSAEPESITFTAVKTERGDLIQVSAGEAKFWVPSVWFSPPNNASGEGMKAQNGRMVSVVDREGSEATMSELSLYLHPSRQASTKSQAPPSNSN